MTAATRIAVAAATATLAAAAPLLVVTATHEWVLPAVLTVGLVAGIGLLARRLRVPAWLVAPLQLGALALWVGALVAGDVGRLGFLPGVDWLLRLQGLAYQGATTIQSYAVPIPVPAGIVLFLVGGVGAVAVVVELLAVTLRRAPWAGVPLAAVYAVPAVVVPGGLDAMWFVPVAAGFLALLVAEGRSRVGRWGRSVSGTRTTGEPETASLARGGRRIGAVAVTAAVVLPALLPGLPQGVLGQGPGQGGSGGRTIETDNPIVDLKRDLTRPDNVEVLRYRTDARPPEYIRSVTLDVFDGTVWQTSDRRVPESQRVEDGMPEPPGWDGSDGTQAHYEVEVSENYRSRWLPLPYPALTVDIEGDWRYDVATLDVVSPDLSTQGVAYSVTSLEVDATAERLRAAAAAGSDVEPMLALPESLSPQVAALAEEVTADAQDDFGRAAALQEFFRTSGGFVYDLSTVPGTSSDALLDFLRDRRGYCEQFAATMAIMARTVGLPSRVAVGFLPGTQEANQDRVVRAHDAHAWPELFFDGVGWVRFEPTPSSRTGSAPAWTVPPVESDPGSEGATPRPAASASAPLGANPRTAEGALGPDGEPLGAVGGVGPLVWAWSALVLAGVLLTLSLPSGVAALRRSRRWRLAGDDPALRAEAAWADLRDAVRDAGLPWDPAATPRSTQRRVAGQARLDDDDRRVLDRLIAAVERARYSRSPGGAHGLRGDAARLRAAVLASASRRRRWRSRLWPATTADAMSTSAGRVADGLDWVDDTGERVRRRAGDLVGHR